MGSGASKAPRDDQKPRIVSPAPILDISEASKRSMGFRPSERRRDTQKGALGKNAKAHTAEPPPGAAGEEGMGPMILWLWFTCCRRSRKSWNAVNHCFRVIQRESGGES